MKQALRIKFNALGRWEEEPVHPKEDWTGLGEHSFSYGDSGVFFICSSYCMMCGEKKDVAAFDTSTGEYAPCFICRDCINAAFDRYATGERTEKPENGEHS